jgi:carbon monoxide dehydrogenase subunit G
MTVVQGERRFAAPPERVFELLVSPDVIASAIPAVRSHSVDDADHWRVKVKPPLPLAPAVTIHFEVVRRDAPAHAALRAHGGGADVGSSFELEEESGGTLMRWRTELQLSGILGRVAGPGLEAVAERQAARTLDAVERAL